MSPSERSESYATSNDARTVAIHRPSGDHIPFPPATLRVAARRLVDCSMTNCEQTVLFDVVTTAVGTGVLSRRDIAEGTEVLRFEGRLVPWADVPAEEVRYVMMDATGEWVIPGSPERFINHSCAPNLRFNHQRGVEAIRPVSAGAELTIAYDVLEPFDLERRQRHPDWYFWDDRWSFDCHCNEAACRGRIDRYVTPESL